jgi:aspartate kinase
MGELTPRSLDAFGSAGEQMSSVILAGYLNTIGIPANLVDARSFMITDNGFTKAFPLFEEIQRLIPSAIAPSLTNRKIVVTQGFIGSTADGVTTTLGRGGSDYSATIIGAVLGAEEIQIWTDVDGIMTADPSIIPSAHQIAEMTFEEAAELAYFGAKVIHPSTVQPACEKNIPVRVLNSRKPGGSGTIIRKELSKNSNGLIKSIAYKEGISVVTVKSTRMLMQSGFLARLFDVFSRHGKSVDVVATSEVTVSLTVDNPSGLTDVEHELSEIATVQIRHDKAIVCIVGERMKYTPGIAARIFTSLDQAGINVEVISQGGSDISLTFVINESEITQAVKALHKTFF